MIEPKWIARAFSLTLLVVFLLSGAANRAVTMGPDGALWQARYERVTATAVFSEDLAHEIPVIRTQAEETVWDDCEINDSLTGTWSASVPPGGPCRIADGETIANLNFVPYTDQPAPNPDYFVVTLKAGRYYHLETRVTSGVDSVIYLYPPGATDDVQYIATNDDVPDLGLGSRIQWTPDSDGDYVIRVVNIEPLPHETAETYTLSVKSEATDADLGWDDCEINDSLTGIWSASVPPGGPCRIADGETTANLNFVPYTDQPAPNPDYFVVTLKAGRYYHLEARVTSGVDSVIYLYPPGATDDEQYIATNDDVPDLGLGSRIQWTPDSDGDYVIRVVNIEPLPHETAETYVLSVKSKATDAFLGWDGCEVNDKMDGIWSDTVGTGDGPCPISVGETVRDLNFVPYTNQPSPNPDYFAVDLKAMRRYRVETMVTAEADTQLFLYRPGAIDDDQYIATNDDALDLGLGSSLEWTTGETSGTWVLRVDNIAPLPHTNDQTYDLRVNEIGCQCDAQEPNWSFDLATLTLAGETLNNLDFVPCDCTTLDKDYFKLPVVTGQTYTCQANSLPDESTGTRIETSIVFCTGPSQEQCLERESDSVSSVAADLSQSLITYTSDYDGWLYSIIEPVGAEELLPEELADLKYSLTCSIVPHRVAVVPKTTPTPAPTPVPVATPTSDSYTIQMASYYDRDSNAQMDAGEGIKNVLVRSYDTTTGELLSVYYTDETGAVIFNVSTSGPVRVSVPFFGLEQIITEPSVSIQIRVAPGP